MLAVDYFDAAVWQRAAVRVRPRARHRPRSQGDRPPHLCPDQGGARDEGVGRRADVRMDGKRGDSPIRRPRAERPSQAGLQGALSARHGDSTAHPRRRRRLSLVAGEVGDSRCLLTGIGESGQRNRGESGRSESPFVHGRATFRSLQRSLDPANPSVSGPKHPLTAGLHSRNADGRRPPRAAPGVRGTAGSEAGGGAPRANSRGRLGQVAVISEGRELLASRPFQPRPKGRRRWKNPCKRASAGGGTRTPKAVEATGS